MPSLAQLTSELASPAAVPGTISLPATAQHSSSLAIDLERNGVASGSSQASLLIGAAQKFQSDSSSSSSNKHVLLPAGVRSLHQSPPALTAVNKLSTCRSRSTSPPSVQHPKSSAQSAYTYSSGASDSETGLYDTRQHACVRGSGVAQLLHDEVLQTADPVAAAVDEAGRVVEEKSRMKSLADQERHALSLHTQARDTFFTAAQVAYEKGMSLTRHLSVHGLLILWIAVHAPGVVSRCRRLTVAVSRRCFAIAPCMHGSSCQFFCTCLDFEISECFGTYGH